ncbi:MAG: hypothetical protein ABSA07_01100 [Acidimicrobiales bacterium]
MSTGRKVFAMGAIALVTTLGMAIPAGAVNSNTVSHVGRVSLTGHAATTKKVVKTTHVAFKGTYSGTMALLWSSTGVTATSVTGHGTGTDGANTMKGSGGGTAANTCDPFSGAGSVVGPSGLKLSIVSSSKTQACAVNSAAPTPVTVTGVAKIVSGTGKFKGATGTLSFKGEFSIQNTTAGSTENDSFSATLTGTLTIKTVTTVKK